MQSCGLVLAITVLSGGCAHLPPYDPAAVVAVRELVYRTKAVVDDGDAGRLSLAESRHFLKVSRTKLTALRSRVIQTHTSAPELAVLDALDKEYASLLDRKSPLRRRAASKLMTDLLTLQDLRPLPDTTIPEISSFGGGDDAICSNDTNSNQSKDCKKDHDHGGRDCGCKSDHR